MTPKEQLLQEIEQAPDSLLEDLLRFYQQLKARQKSSLDELAPHSSERITVQREAISWLQAKMRETVPRERSLVDELIAERRMEGKNE